LYDKQTSELYNYQQQFIFENGRYHFGFFNDYDGGLPFNPQYSSGEYLIEACNAENFAYDYTRGRDMKECNENGTFCKIQHYDIRSDRYSSIQRKNIIEQICKQITADSSTILIVAKTKNNE
jgi:hypothetical protein